MNTWRSIWLYNFLTLVCLLTQTGGIRKSKRMKESRSLPPQYEEYKSNDIPNDRQISVFLRKGKPKTLYYESKVIGTSLSFTIATCTSPVVWFVRSRTIHSSDMDQASAQLMANLTTNETDTFSFKSQQANYSVEMLAAEGDSFAHVYLSTEPGGPQAIQTSRNLTLKLNHRHRRKQLTINWEPSLVDPQSTVYCLVVNTKKHYRTLCTAQGEKYGVIPAIGNTRQTTILQTGMGYNSERYNPEPIIGCVGHNNHYTVKNMVQGVGYYFDLFATNRQSNLTYHRGSSFLTFDNRIKPTRLKDGKLTYVNLKKYDGRVMLRFKSKKTGSSPIQLYIISCGGAVDVEVSVKGSIVAPTKRIDSYGKITIEKPKQGLRYYIKIVSTNREELRRTSGVEILATTKTSSLPLPNMPSDLRVVEYESLRRCDSVTVGWITSPEQQTFHYCVYVKPIGQKELDINEPPNQCDLEKQLRKSKQHIGKYCKDIKKIKEEIVTQKIKNLKPDRNYEIQVTVKKSKSKTLSYNLLRVKTKRQCERSNKTRLKTRSTERIVPT